MQIKDIALIVMVFVYIVFLAISLYIMRKNKNDQIATELSFKKRLQQQNRQKQQELKLLQKETQNYRNKIFQLRTALLAAQEQLDNELENKQTILKQAFNDVQRHYEEAFSNYEQVLAQAYDKKDLEFKTKISKLQEEQVQAQKELDQIKNILQAVAAAKVRSKLEQDKIDYYKIQLTPSQFKDIEFLYSWKAHLSDSTLVSKIIWSSIIMKATSALCNRVLETSAAVCGIYKITNLITNEVYIGQSTDIASRWKTHIKYGLGIDAPSTNKLYNNMQDYGVWSFTFQLLQKCPRDKLNEKERFWIETYNSNNIGLNSTKGNTT